MKTTELPVAVIGAGPVGLAAAAHLVERGLTPAIFETGDAAGHSVRQWAHVRMFSPWKFNIDGAAGRLLDAAGWQRPADGEIPTGGDLVARYIEPLADLPALRRHLRLGTRIAGVGRRGMDKVPSEGRAERPFVLRTVGPDGEGTVEARAVIDASGTWASPNPAGAGGWPAIGEGAAAAHIAYGIPDVLSGARPRYAGRRTLVVGGGHSALNALIDLAALRREAPGTRILWALRKDNVQAAFGGGAADQLPARGALGSQVRALVEAGAVEVVAPFRLSRIESRGGGLRIDGGGEGRACHVIADEIIVATGFRPDFSFLREVRLSLDPWLESSGALGPLIDPNLHSCGTVRPHGERELAHAEAGFYIAGMKSYGRAPTFLLATGHEQVRSIVAALAGDRAAAERVELSLPETGVCSTPPASKAEKAAGCCGPAPVKQPEPVAASAACCAPSCCA